MFKQFLKIFAGSSAICLSASALASTGTMSGEFVFTQMQHHCGVGNGTKYPCTQKGQEAKVRRARVEILRNSDSAVIGTGWTGTDGVFNMSWTDNSAPGNVVVKLRWRSEHQDGRFQIRDNTGNGLWAFNVSGTFTAVANGLTPIGKKNWGSNELANVYDGATKMWENSLSQSNRMNSYFGNLTPPGSGATSYVQIRTNVDDGTCATGGAFDDLNRICLPSNSNLRNQSRVMHEMGHLASFRATRDQTAFGRADTSLSGSGWSFDTAEWNSRQFTEGVATALANVGLYFQNANTPFTCGNASTSCDTAGGFSLEATPASCATERRWELSTERYFWDIYDSVNDSESLSMPMWHIVDTIHAFDPGTGNRQKSEVGSSISDPDGHSTTDFMENWKVWGTDSSAVLTKNCQPSGTATDTATTGCSPAGGQCPAPD